MKREDLEPGQLLIYNPPWARSLRLVHYERPSTIGQGKLLGKVTQEGPYVWCSHLGRGYDYNINYLREPTAQELLILPTEG